MRQPSEGIWSLPWKRPEWLRQDDRRCWLPADMTVFALLDEDERGTYQPSMALDPTRYAFWVVPVTWLHATSSPGQSRTPDQLTNAGFDEVTYDGLAERVNLIGAEVHRVLPGGWRQLPYKEWPARTSEYENRVDAQLFDPEDA